MEFQWESHLFHWNHSRKSFIERPAVSGAPNHTCSVYRGFFNVFRLNESTYDLNNYLVVWTTFSGFYSIDCVGVDCAANCQQTMVIANPSGGKIVYRNGPNISTIETLRELSNVHNTTTTTAQHQNGNFNHRAYTKCGSAGAIKRCLTKLASAKATQHWPTSITTSRCFNSMTFSCLPQYRHQHRQQQ